MPRVKTAIIYYTRYQRWLDNRNFCLNTLRSGLSDNFNKVHVVHKILLIIVTWCRVNEPTLKTIFSIYPKKKKKKNRSNIVLCVPFIRKCSSALWLVHWRLQKRIDFYRFNDVAQLHETSPLQLQWQT